MAWQLTPYAVPPLVAAAVSVVLMGYVWRHRDDRLTQVFFVLLLAITAWSLAYAIQLSHTTLAEQLFWQRFGLSIGGTIPTIWLVFALVYTEAEQHLSKGIVALMLIDPVAFAVLAWTNGAHGLLWSTADLAPRLGLDLEFTVIYFLHITYAYLLVLIGIGLLVAVFFRSSAIYRRQTGLMIFGAVVPLSANMAFTLGVSPVPGLDFTTPTFALTGLVLALAMFRFDLLDLTPVARRRVLDEFGSGVLVVDDQARVVHINETASEVIPRVSVGDPLAERFAVDSIDALDGHVATIEDGGRERFYDFSVSSLRDFRDRQVGHVVAMRDATTDRQYEQRLEVVNRLLRHNLRNDMNKVAGWAKIAEEGAEGEALSALRRIQTVADDVAEMSRRAKRIEEILEARSGDLVEVDAACAMVSVVEGLQQRWPEANIELSVLDSARVQSPAPELLEVAFRNVVENAIEHADRSPPHVEISVRTASGSGREWIVVEVADDGPGIPPIETEALLSGEETALQHGSGLGLWLVRWITGTAGGDLSFAENDPRGTIVTIRLQPA